MKAITGLNARGWHHNSINVVTLDFYFNFKYIHIDIFVTSKDVDKLL
jgi:hypothetical protein